MQLTHSETDRDLGCTMETTHGKNVHDYWAASESATSSTYQLLSLRDGPMILEIELLGEGFTTRRGHGYVDPTKCLCSIRQHPMTP